MRDWVVCVNVHDAAVTDLKSRIAQACGAMWVINTLTPDEVARVAIGARALRNRTTQIAASLKASSPDARAARAEVLRHTVDPMMATGFDDIVFYQLLSAIGPERLAALGPGDRFVLSTMPTQRQLRLPDAAEILSSYIARRNAASEAEHVREAALIAKNLDDKSFKEFFHPLPSWAITTPPAKTILILTGRAELGLGAGIRCDLVFYGADRSILGIESGRMAGGIDSNGVEAAVADSQFKSTPKPNQTPITLSEEADDLARFIENGGSSTAFLNPPLPGSVGKERVAKILRRIARPESIDPLTYSADIVVGLGHAINAQVVECLPDTFTPFLSDASLYPLTPSNVQRKLLADEDVVTNIGEGWLTVSPATFARVPINRSALAKLGATLAAFNEPTIDQLSSAAAAGFGDPREGAVGQMALLMNPQELMRVWSNDWRMLRLYGSMSSAQRSELKLHHRLPVSALSKAQCAAVERMIYDASRSQFRSPVCPLTVDAKAERGGPPEVPLHGTYGPDRISPQDFRSEPTEVAPNGLAPILTITSSEEKGRVVSASFTGDTRKTSSYDGDLAFNLHMIAYDYASSELPPIGEGWPVFPKFDHVRTGFLRTLHFKIYVSNESFERVDLTDTSFEEGKTYDLKALPAPLQKRFDDELKRAREEVRSHLPNHGLGTGNGGANPLR